MLFVMHQNHFKKSSKNKMKTHREKEKDIYIQLHLSEQMYTHHLLFSELQFNHINHLAAAQCIKPCKYKSRVSKSESKKMCFTSTTFILVLGKEKTK